MIDLSVKIGSLLLANPIMTASGTFGYAEEFANFIDINELGAVITKTVTPEPRSGNPPRRIVELQFGMLNSIGLPNVGIEKFIQEKIPYLQTLKTRIIINVAGKTGQDFVECVEKLEHVSGIAGYELNFSCPNVKEGGMSFSADPKIAEQVTSKVRRVTQKIVIAKLTPNVTSIGTIGKAVEIGGADAVSAVNTFVGMAVDVKSKKSKLSTITGGYSGPAIKPMALAKVYELCNSVKIPVIAIGGIFTAIDALEFMITGATAFQVGTANFSNPQAAIQIKEGLIKYCQKNNITDIKNIIATLKY